MSNELPIHEAFFSFQGEGAHLGRAAYFVRTLGCPVKCSFCDSAGTWHPDFVPDRKDVRRVSNLARDAAKSGASFSVLTGGEPTIFDLTPYVRAMFDAGIKTHLETSGAFPIKGQFDWVTVSPKFARLPLRENLDKADELKIIVENPGSIREWEHLLSGTLRPSTIIWLHFEWSQRENPDVLRTIVEAVKNNPRRYRAGIQMHKYFNADKYDPNTKGLVPLGGDITRGY